MSENLKELPSRDSVYDLYKGRRDETSEKEVPQKVDLELRDSEEMQEKMNHFAKEVFSKYQVVTEDDPDTYTRSYDDEQLTKTNVHLGETIIDPDIPLVMDVSKNFTNEKGRKSQSINFYLYKGQEGAQEYVGNISIAERGDGRFDFHDRLVDPKFRKQGIGKMLFNLSDAFMQGVANEKQEDTESYAKMSQLHMIFQFWSQGYRPESKKDWDRLEKIISGDSSLEIAERDFVFERSISDDDKYFKMPNGKFARNGEGKRVINYNNAYRIVMVKKFEVGESEDVEGVREETRAEIKEA